MHMALGYDGGKLYFLAFDHRGSFQKKMFGIEGDPTNEQTATISDAKHLIYEGMVKAVEAGGADASTLGVLVGEDFGAHITSFDPDFSKVLVRYNPDDDAELNARQLERLKRLADWLHDNGR